MTGDKNRMGSGESIKREQGQRSDQSRQESGRQGGQSGGGNFANDRQKASEAGRKGGQNSGGGGRDR
jgi:general stress protein YciG